MEAVFAELNYPSAGVLKQALRSRGIPFDSKEVDALVKGEVTRQVQAPAPQSAGKIASDSLNDVWFADLIDLTQAPNVEDKLRKGSGGEKYVLVVQDVFSRKLWARPLVTKRPDEVAPAFADILREVGAEPSELVVDKGGEFLKGFRQYVLSRGIQLNNKTSLRQISTLDSAIGSLKRALVRDLRRAKTDDWAGRLDKVVEGQNKVPKKDYLEGNAPASVEGDDALQRRLEEKNREFNQHNREQIQDREAQLQEAGYFRTRLDRPLNFARGFKPIWSNEVYKVASTNWDEVTDDRGRIHKTKFVLPVPRYAEKLEPRRIEAGKPAQAEERKTRILDDVATEVRRWIGARTVTLSQVGAFLAQWNFRTLSLEARLNMKAPVAGFLRAFPKVFDVRADRMGRSYVSVIPAQPAFEGATRLRRR